MTTHHPHRRSPIHPRRLLALFALLGALAVLGAACSSAAGDQGELAVDVTVPSDGAQVGESFDVEVNASVPFGEPDTGRQHLHIYVDGNTSEGEYLIIYDDDPFTVSDLSPGEHTIEARIANADHSSTDARDEITVTVGEGAGGANRPTPTSDDPDLGY